MLSMSKTQKELTTATMIIIIIKSNISLFISIPLIYIEFDFLNYYAYLILKKYNISLEV